MIFTSHLPGESTLLHANDRRNHTDWRIFKVRDTKRGPLRGQEVSLTMLVMQGLSAASILPLAGCLIALSDKAMGGFCATQAGSGVHPAGRVSARTSCRKGSFG